MTGRWWRRNWWGLLAVVPVLALLVWLSPDHSYEQWRDAEPREEVRPGADGWVSYGGARLRLEQVGSARVEDSLGAPYPVPDGVRAWGATVTIGVTGDDPEALLGCELRLEDEQGRLFGSQPQELLGAYLDGEPVDGTLCTPSLEQEGQEQFQVRALFALPENVEPAALRVTQFEALPAYVRFDTG